MEPRHRLDELRRRLAALRRADRDGARDCDDPDRPTEPKSRSADDDHPA